MSNEMNGPNGQREKTDFSRELRNNMTPEERHLWYDFLCRLPFTVKRQQVIGEYYADFYVHKYRLVIEIDGRQHGLPEQREHDDLRTEYLNSRGIEVIRYTNTDVRRNFRGVCNDLMRVFGLGYEQLRPPRISGKRYGFSKSETTKQTKETNSKEQ